MRARWGVMPPVGTRLPRHYAMLAMLEAISSAGIGVDDAGDLATPGVDARSAPAVVEALDKLISCLLGTHRMVMPPTGFVSITAGGGAEVSVLCAQRVDR